MSAGPLKLDNLIAIVDVNNHAGRRPLDRGAGLRAAAGKWEAFGWHVQRVDGNDIDAVVEAFDRRARSGSPSRASIICDTKMGKGVPFLETREKSHFLRVERERMAAGARGARCQPAGGSRAGGPHEHAAAPHAARAGRGRQQQKKPRLTTSAMIASLAGEGQRTRPAPFGHALVEAAKTGPRSSA